MASPSRDSPASKAFADKLARFAYDPSASGPVSPLRGSSRLAATKPPVSPARTLRGAAKAKLHVTDGHPAPKPEVEDENEDIASPSRKRAKTTPVKAVKKARPFAAPEVYAHLRPVNDHLKPDLGSASRNIYQETTDDSHFLRYQVGFSPTDRTTLLTSFFLVQSR